MMFVVPKQGFFILRFWDNQVLKDIEPVIETILNLLGKLSDTPHLNPPPQGGEEVIWDPHRKGGGDNLGSSPQGGRR
jgi:hypothetical protein